MPTRACIRAMPSKFNRNAVINGTAGVIQPLVGVVELIPAAQRARLKVGQHRRPQAVQILPGGPVQRDGVVAAVLVPDAVQIGVDAPVPVGVIGAPLPGLGDPLGQVVPVKAVGRGHDVPVLRQLPLGIGHGAGLIHVFLVVGHGVVIPGHGAAPPQMIGQLHPQALRPVLAGDAGEEDQLARAAVVHALKLPAGAHGPVAGVGFNAELVFQLVQQLKRVAGLAVHLVDKGKDRDMAHGADLEELPGLRLDAFRAVDDHDGRVRRHERAVGVLGKVLVAGGVEDVDAEALILELQDGRGHGDAALLLDLHPVRSSGFRPLALDLAGLRDGSAVEQELFRESGLTGVRVGDDGKGPPPGDLFL